MEWSISFIHSADSTNSYLTQRDEEAVNGFAIAALSQTAGRGQRGNSWESEAGENMTLSVALRSEGLDIGRAFGVSEAVAMAAVRVLDSLMPDCEDEIAVKWPNDIYVGEKKIGGILIENSLSGRMIVRSIAGIGLNINQKRFVSDAPNPVSIFQLTGREHAIPAVAAMFMSELDGMVELSKRDANGLHALYMSRLWRREGLHPFRETSSGERFEAEIAGIGSSGFITLRDSEGKERTYAFKEIEWERDV